MDGKMVYLAFLSGAVADKFNLAVLLRKRLTLKGSTLRSRTVDYQHELLNSFAREALPMIVKGEMTVEVHDVYPWTKVQEAQKEMAANKNSGKVSPRGYCEGVHVHGADGCSSQIVFEVTE